MVRTGPKVMGFADKNRRWLIRHAYHDMGVSVQGLKAMNATDKEIKEFL
tara:strand:+ start:142 stop:288 length:147 start_codon:yes stop_codon:yes gene_type:complete